MQWLAALCVKRPVFAWVLVLSLTVVGLFAFGRLGVDRFPNIDIPTISVTTRLPGAAPEQIETEVTDKIEESVNTISGIDTLTSTSVGGHLAGGGVVQAREERGHRRPGSARSRQPRHAAAAADGVAADGREARLPGVAGDHRGRDRRQAGPRHHRVRRPRAAAAAGELGWRRPGRGDRRPEAPGQPVARSHAAAGTKAVGQRRGPRAAVAERRRARRPARPGRAVGDAPDARPHRDDCRFRRRRASRSERPPGSPARCGARRGRHGRAPHAGQCEWRGHGVAADPQAVGHQHGRSRQQRQTAARRARDHPAARIPAAHRPRRGAVHRGVDRQRPGAPDRRVDSRGDRGVRVPRECPLHDDCGDRDSDLDRRHLRADLVHGLHAQHADHAGAHAIGRHRDRRRHRGAREHLSLHRGEGHAADAGGG